MFVHKILLLNLFEIEKRSLGLHTVFIDDIEIELQSAFLRFFCIFLHRSSSATFMQSMSFIFLLRLPSAIVLWLFIS